MALQFTLSGVVGFECLFVREKLVRYNDRESIELQFILPLITPAGKLLTLQETLDFYRTYSAGALDRSSCFVHRIKAEKFNDVEFTVFRDKLKPGNLLKFYYYDSPYILRDANRKVISEGETKKLVKLEVIETGLDVSFVEIQEETNGNYDTTSSFGEYARAFN